MKLMILVVLIGLTVDNASRQDRTRPRKRFVPPRLGRQRLYKRVLKKLLPKQPLPPLTREMVRERSWS